MLRKNSYKNSQQSLFYSKEPFMKKLFFALAPMLLIGLTSNLLLGMVCMSPRKPINFFWIEEGIIAGMACPVNTSHLQWLENQNIGLIASLTDQALAGRFQHEQIKINILHLPTKYVPSKESVDTFIKETEKILQNNKAVVVHCVGGNGRTGTFLACWLITHNKLSSDEALEKIRAINAKYVEGPDQEEFIHWYATQLS